MNFNLSETNDTGVAAREQVPDASSAFAAEGLFSLAAGDKQQLAQNVRTNPWGDVTSGGQQKKPDVTPPDLGQVPGADRLYPTDPRSNEQKELLKKVQDLAKTNLDAALKVNQYEKNLVIGLQSSLLAGDTDMFRYYLKDLYQGLGYSQRTDEQKTEQVRDDLRVMERIMRQTCGVDISLDVTWDDRVIVRIKPETLALEIRKDGDRVKQVVEAPGSVSLDHSKEVIIPTARELKRSISDRLISTRMW